MTSESLSAPVVPGILSKPDIGITQPPSQPVSQQENSDIQIPVPTKKIESTSGEPTVDEPNSSQDVNPTEEAKLTEDSKHPDSASAPATIISGAPMSNGNTSQPAVGDKREREAAAPSTAPDKPSTDDPLEPSPKKQRTGEDNSEIAHGSSSSPVPTATEKPSEVSNGEKKKKKKGGRPKKTNDAINRNIPADGIGSRTRSRTKVVS